MKNIYSSYIYIIKRYLIIVSIIVSIIIIIYCLFISIILESVYSQKKILIIGSLPYHYECVGFLCEIMNNSKIYISANEDRLKYIDYYKMIYNIDVINDKNLNYDNYDYIIKLTSNDPIIDTNNKEIVNLYKKKLISIIHIEEKKDFLNNYIIICPYFTIADSISEYIFPIYRGLLFDNETKDIILYLGYFTRDSFDDDINDFNKQIKDKYKLMISSYIDNSYLEEYNIKNLHNVDTVDLLKYLNKTKYILSKKIPLGNKKDRLSGAIPFAISHNIPLIIRKDIADDYSINNISVTFNEKYCEIIPEIMNNNDNNYQKMIKNIDQYKNEKINENKIKMKKLLNNLRS